VENATVDNGGNKVEFMLCRMSFPKDQRMINNDPNVWIADLAAMVHATPPHGMGMQSKNGNG
jgi:hypothetical protein